MVRPSVPLSNCVLSCESSLVLVVEEGFICLLVLAFWKSWGSGAIRGNHGRGNWDEYLYSFEVTCALFAMFYAIVRMDFRDSHLTQLAGISRLGFFSLTFDKGGRTVYVGMYSGSK